MPQGKILVIRGGAIGDFILTLPVLTALREQFPQTGLELLGYPRVTQLAHAAGLVDKTASIEERGLATFFARGAGLPARWADYFEEFAVIVSYLYDPDQIFHDNVARCSQAQFIEGPHRPDEGGDLHASKVFLRPLERLAIFDPDPTPRLRVGPTDLGSTHSTAPKSLRLALHPGSGSERKNWPESNWRELLLALASDARLRFLLVGGEAEGDRLERLAALLPRERTNVARSLPLGELAAQLQGCTAFVGHDSGISHLAAALGRPGLVLWGATNAEVWRPLSDRMALLRSPTGLAGISVTTVL